RGRDAAAGAGRKGRALLKDEPGAVFERVVAVALQQLKKTPFARPNRRNLGAVIAHGALRYAHVCTDDRRDLGIFLSRPEELYKGQLQTFGINISGNAAELTADILPVGHR